MFIRLRTIKHCITFRSWMYASNSFLTPLGKKQWGIRFMGVNFSNYDVDAPYSKNDRTIDNASNKIDDVSKVLADEIFEMKKEYEDKKEHLYVVAQSISSEISNLRKEHQAKQEELNKKVNAAMDQLEDLYQTWADNIEFTCNNKDGNTTQLMMAESRLEGLRIAKRIIVESLT